VRGCRRPQRIPQSVIFSGTALAINAGCPSPAPSRDAAGSPSASVLSSRLHSVGRGAWRPSPQVPCGKPPGTRRGLRSSSDSLRKSLMPPTRMSKARSGPHDRACWSAEPAGPGRDPAGDRAGGKQRADYGTAAATRREALDPPPLLLRRRHQKPPCASDARSKSGGCCVTRVRREAQPASSETQKAAGTSPSWRWR
jgi:hypothetical protein